MGKIDINSSNLVDRYSYSMSDVWKLKIRSSNLGCNAVYSLNQLLYAFIVFNGTSLYI